MLVGSGITLLALALGGHVTAGSARFALLMSPLLLVGVLAGRHCCLGWAEATARRAVMLMVALGSVVLAGKVLG